MPKLLGSVWLR